MRHVRRVGLRLSPCCCCRFDDDGPEHPECDRYLHKCIHCAIMKTSKRHKAVEVALQEKFWHVLGCTRSGELKACGCVAAGQKGEDNLSGQPVNQTPQSSIGEARTKSPEPYDGLY